jgi:DNA excision repair protein ERCC-2
MTGSWRDVFGHEAPYEEQVDGIETAIEAARDGGFLALEGACGTGKTMLALTAGLHLVRDPDSRFERVLALTSVKQQLRQFEEDVERINAELPDDWRPVSGLTLVGKADVCPYSREEAAGIDDANVYDRCEDLRDTTRALTGDGPASAGALVDDARSQQIGLADSGAEGGVDYLETAGEPSPYPTGMPTRDDAEYCPFYARYLDDKPDEDGDPAEAVPFDFTDAGLIDPEELVRRSVGAGTCPHSMMGAILPHAELVLGNYYHAFDPMTTGSFTGALLDETTFVICDEAHMLEPRVRDLVSDTVSDRSLRDAEAELTRVLQALQFDGKEGQSSADADLVRAELQEAEVDRRELETYRSFIRDLREELDRRITAHLEREHRGWKSDLAGLPDEEIPLRDPETPAVDEITEWAERLGYDDRAWSRAESVGAVVKRILDEADDDTKQRAAPSVGRVLGRWYRADHEGHFREIELDRTWDETEPPDSWRRAYNASLAIHNCVPGDVIGERLAEFGGGVLMSATLEPLDVFADVTGLNHLEHEEDRPVVTRTYGLTFPPENRESFAVDAPKFTYDNRGAPSAEPRSADDASGQSPRAQNPTRRAYADAIREVAQSPGNVLVGMPSYREAEWAAEQLRESVDKPVLIDESSGDDATEQLKGEFFDGEGKVLVTSLRGTLTEGVDYRGDRLSAAVICGVPIVDTTSPRTRAIRTAYDETFGDGFEYALTVPAVRKARQAIGRVIRGSEEVGVRVFVDARYARDSWDSVREYVPGEEFQPVSPDMLSLGLERFWTKQS